MEQNNVMKNDIIEGKLTNRIAENLIERLISYGLHTELINEYDVNYIRNTLCDLFGIQACQKNCCDTTVDESLRAILDGLSAFAAANGICGGSQASVELFETRVMGLFVVQPSAVIEKFYRNFSISPRLATDEFYKFCKACNYIQTDRIAKNKYWKADTGIGELEITVNLSKPEKDPADIAMARLYPATDYPKCLLCVENVGFAGTVTHPARQNLRVIPVNLSGEEWYFQYSPYVYYNEHCIVLSAEHTPMKTTKTTFSRLLDFVDTFDGYFIGSNADIPIVGGSILSHEHYQGGRHVFPMEKTEAYDVTQSRKYQSVKFGKLHWPMSVMRLWSDDKAELVEFCVEILDKWRCYKDEEAGILPENNANAVASIARKRDGLYEMDLILRNNRTSEQHPLGIFHPHAELHHIKKENIGLIEVMGLAVLPGRLERELDMLTYYLTGDKDISELKTNKSGLIDHYEWMQDILKKYKSLKKLSKIEAYGILMQEVGLVFERVLSDCGVFKRDTNGMRSFNQFTSSLN